MGELSGLKEYLDQRYQQSIFDQAVKSGQTFMLHMHNQKRVSATIAENCIYDIKADIEGKEELIQKIQIKYLYPSDLHESVKPLIKEDKEVRKLVLEPIGKPHERFFVKNKTLFPLMKEMEVVFFTLLEGDIIRGIITDFSRYEIIVHLKGGIPLTLLRHSIYDLKNKNGRCFLKSFQEEKKDWEKSKLYISET